MLKVAIIHNPHCDHVPTISYYHSSFKKYSKNQIIIVNSIQKIQQLCKPEIIKNIDIVCYTYASWYWAGRQTRLFAYFKKLNKNLKMVMFLQDEYWKTKYKKRIINLMDLVFTVIDEKTANEVLVKNKKYKQVLTGYVYDHLKKIPINKKEVLIFYRGRNLHYSYGTLGYDKIHIGKKMKEYCDRNKIKNINIEWEEDKRIYGDDWFKILSNSKVTLATESGCKIFDETEQLIKNIDDKLKINPNYSYEEAEKDFSLKKLEKYNTCGTSPKMFEAVCLGTVLIMYPGNYAGIFKKDIHYIELQKDFSNIEDVMKKVNDDEFLQNMADRAYKDIVQSGKYTYKEFINIFDNTIQSLYNS